MLSFKLKAQLENKKLHLPIIGQIDNVFSVLESKVPGTLSQVLGPKWCLVRNRNSINSHLKKL